MSNAVLFGNIAVKFDKNKNRYNNLDNIYQKVINKLFYIQK